MPTPALHLALIGDYNTDVTAHQAIPVALQQAADALGLSVKVQWLATDTLTCTSALHDFDGFWCVPGSPYRDIDGALRAVELLDHPFFVATLFQPERAALKGITPPLAIALLKACQEVSV
ncbi:hypothetical protein [Pseudomonas sp. L13]|uniref:hypothetical protein n=1 Tax=Pseudomonas sp. L13 TaxID=343985 RepID=UPI0013794800|nr:hypothetical protein [Pseudomonas sp. L13]NCE93763.1 hypothetical protein [Pseudomonas sp. L13]